MAEAFDTLLAAMRDELAALDSGDAGEIERATMAKIAALEGARSAGAIAVDRLHEARALNALAATRSNRGKFLCGGSSQLGLGVIHTAGDSCWFRPG